MGRKSNNFGENGSETAADREKMEVSCFRKKSICTFKDLEWEYFFHPQKLIQPENLNRLIFCKARIEIEKRNWYGQLLPRYSSEQE